MVLVILSYLQLNVLYYALLLAIDFEILYSIPL